MSAEHAEIVKKIFKSNHVAVALIKNSVISIQELLMIASAQAKGMLTGIKQGS